MLYHPGSVGKVQEREKTAREKVRRFFSFICYVVAVEDIFSCCCLHSTKTNLRKAQEKLVYVAVSRKGQEINVINDNRDGEEEKDIGKVWERNIKGWP